MKHTDIEPVFRDNLLAMARVCAEARGVKLTTLSGEAHGDPPFFDRLVQKKGSFTFRKYDEIMKWFAANWPKGVKRPKLRKA